MAKIKLGPIVTDISGSVKKIIFARYCVGRHAAKSRAGIYQNPQSPQQAAVRAVTKEAGAMWTTSLTPPQRDNWNEYAQGLKPQEDTSHSTRSLIPKNRGIMSGFHAFLGAYSQVRRSGITVPASFYNSPLGQTGPSALTGLNAAFTPLAIPNYALIFDGVDEWVNVGNVLNYEFNQPQSWEYWINIPAHAPTRFIFGKKDGAPNKGYDALYSGNTLMLELTQIAAGKIIRVTRVFNTLNVWKHIVMTYDGSNNPNGMRIYVDTVVGQVVTNNVPLVGTMIHADPLRFGRYSSLVGNYFKGRIQCIRNYNRVIIQAEVNQVFNAGAGLYGANPFGDGSCQGAWMFCTGSGITLFDISGNNYHGTLQNMEPGDWVPGHVPCPPIPAHIPLTWTDPVIVIPNSKIRVWIRTRELGVHRQLIYNVDLGEELVPITQVRMSQGALHGITDFPGHYLIQADIIQPNGLKSPPSHTVEVTVS